MAMPTPPTMIGMIAAFIPCRFRAACISRDPRTRATATSRTNAGLKKTRLRTTYAPSPTPIAIAFGRSRPARLGTAGAAGGTGSGAGSAVTGWRSRCSDVEQLGFLVLEDVVDLVDVLLGRGVELLLGPGHLVLPGLLVLDQLVQGVLGRAPRAA